jgi:hypothetical protein
MNALVQTADGLFVVDLETELVLAHEPDEELEPEPPLELGLPRVIDTAATGSTVIALVERRPPLVVSHDAGRTWHEAGGGLPPGRAVAVSPDDPDLVLFAARNRLYLSSDGGRFWRSLAPELPEIAALSWEV